MRWPLVALAVVLAACGGPARTSTTKPAPRADRTAPFRASALREPAVFIRVDLGAGQVSARQVTSLPSEYEGALLEGLNARAVPARDVRLLTRERLTPAEALARAREVGADHVLMIEARLLQREMSFCRDEKPFRAVTTVWSQKVRVFRASDGALAFETKNPIDVPAVEADCETPRDSRRRSPAEHLAAAVEALLKRLLGS